MSMWKTSFFDPCRILFWPVYMMPQASSETHWANKSFRGVILLEWLGVWSEGHRLMEHEVHYAMVIWLEKCVCGCLCALPYRRYSSHPRPWEKCVFSFLFLNRFSWFYPSFISFFPVDVYISFTFKLLSTPFHHSNTSSQKHHFMVSRSFHLKYLYTMDTCFFSAPHTHTYTLRCPHNLVPGAPQSVFMIPSDSPFHFASLYLSHITLKIEGEQAWSVRRETEYPCWNSLWTSALHHTHTCTHNTHTQLVHLTVSWRKERKPANPNATCFPK